ncbi:hypothetical protein BJH93_07870 [Kocuria polaris]|nr:hypothetical protein [Kocuria polaris]
MNPRIPAAGRDDAPSVATPATPRTAATLRAAASAAVVLLALTACATAGGAGNPTTGATSSSSATPPEPLVIGAPEPTREARIVAELYAGALNRAGIAAEVDPDIGAWGQYEDALRSGGVDVVPEFGGDLLFHFDGKTTARAGGDVYDELAAALPEELVALAPSEATRQPVLVMTRAESVAHGVTALEDLGEVCEDLTFGGPQSLLTRADGVPALGTEYDCEPKSFNQLSSGADVLEAVITDRVQVGQMASTDPNIAGHSLVILQGSAEHFTAQPVVPIVHGESVGDEARDVLDRVSRELSAEDLAELNSSLMGDAPLTAPAAAATWLTEHGFGD